MRKMTRRLAGKTGAALGLATAFAQVKVGNAFAGTPIGAKPGVLHRGRVYPVTDWWHETYTVPHPDLATRSMPEIDRERVKLQVTSHYRHMTPAEYARVEALDVHFNVRNKIDRLKGRSISDFGFEGHDEVHTQSIAFPKPAGCGCKLETVTHHHKGRAGEVVEHHPHYPIYVCEDHAGHYNSLALADFHAHVHEHNAALRSA